jgi:cation transport ATPase
VFDKTGTLTYGRPEGQRVLPADGSGAEVLIDAVATAVVRSEHPLGCAILEYVRSQKREIGAGSSRCSPAPDHIKKPVRLGGELAK